jgi:putative acetyltransferase
MVIRCITANEAGEDSALVAGLVRVFCEARRRRLAFMMEIHDAEEDRRFLSGRMLAENEVWIGEVEGEMAGFIAFAGGWVNQLYVSPEFQGMGVGSRLLEVAKGSGARLELWVFAENEPAIAFYERRGFRIVERTDGARNEAKRADVRMVWEG